MEELRKAIEMSKQFKEEEARTNLPTTKAVDRYILLESRLERTITGSATEASILRQLSKLEVIGGVTIDDVIKRKQELREGRGI